MYKYCPECGTKFTDNKKECLNCGFIPSNQINLSVQDKNAKFGLTMGLISIVAWLIPSFGFPITIIGILFSAKGISSEINKGQAIAGLLLSIIFLVFTFLNSLLGVLTALNTMA